RAVDVDKAGEAVRARLAVEVPGRVGGGDRAAERVAADHHRAPAALRLQHDLAQVADLGVHAPVAGEPDVRVRHGLVVGLDARVREVAEVVVEGLLRRRLSGLGGVEHRLVLEQVFAPLDRPHLPAGDHGDYGLGQRLEVGRAGRGAGVEHEDV